MGILGNLFKAKIHPTSVNDTNFESEVIQSDLPVIVDVWSPGCGPCKQLEEVMMNITNQYEGRVKVCELNSSGAMQVAARLRISATPTVIYFKGGKELERVVGFKGSLYHKGTIKELFGEE